MVNSDEGFYKFLEYELDFQRKRKQEIFSWASSLLVAIIGGVITLTVVHGAMLPLAYKWAVTFAVVILGAYSWFWIQLHWGEYFQVRDKLSFYYNQTYKTNSLALRLSLNCCYRSFVRGRVIFGVVHYSVRLARAI